MRTSGNLSKASKRQLIDTGRDKRYLGRNSQDEFDESDDVNRILSEDLRRTAEATLRAGRGP